MNVKALFVRSNSFNGSVIFWKGKKEGQFIGRETDCTDVENHSKNVKKSILYLKFFDQRKLWGQIIKEKWQYVRLHCFINANRKVVIQT